MGCLVPALFRIPDDEWICPGCQPLMTEETIADSGAEEQELDYGQKGAGDILQDDLTMTVLKERHGLPYKEISPPANLEAKQWTRALKRARKRARSYFIEQGNVYKLSKDCSEKPRRVPPAQQRYQLIKEVHALGHVGITKCAQLLGKRLYWHNMYKDITEYVRNCEVCKERKVKFITYPELRSIEPEGLFSMVAMDTLGAFPPSAAGNKYVAVCVEYFSRWVEAKAIPDLKSATLAKFFEEEIICRHGCPSTCITDNGAEFKLDFANLLTKNNIQHKHSAPFHPQGNGLAERCNQWMLRALQRKAADDPASWDQHIP
jgi:transposase InsO family protein